MGRVITMVESFICETGIGLIIRDWCSGDGGTRGSRTEVDRDSGQVEVLDQAGCGAGAEKQDSFMSSRLLHVYG